MRIEDETERLRRAFIEALARRLRRMVRDVGRPAPPRLAPPETPAAARGPR